MECKIGIVTQVHATEVDILISRNSACAGCHVQSACTSQDKKEQLITVRHYPPTLRVGERVRIVGDAKLGLRAVVYSFVVPIVLILVTLLYMSARGVDEIIIALTILGVLGAYALILVLLRSYFEKSFALRAEYI